MKLSQLRRLHAEYDATMLATYPDLVEGGRAFQRNVANYLPKHDREPDAVYKRRCASAHYLGYIAPIVNYFASWLFSSPLTFKCEPEDTDKFWDEFKEDVTGTGVDLDQFLRARFIEAVTTRSAFWRVCFPDPGAPLPEGAVVADYDAEGRGHAYLKPVPAKNVINWRRDERGSWIWVLERECTEELLDVADDEVTVTETFTQWFADGSAKCWKIDYPKSKPPPANKIIPEIEAPANPCRAIPLVELRVPFELWIVNHLASSQIEHFRKSCALSWAIDRTCYSMPFFFLKNKKKPPVMGAGYYGILAEGEKVDWPTPPATSFQTIQETTSRLKDEMHRVTHQMAMGADNNAAAIGRSGESKIADNAATEIVLSAFGRVSREPVEVTFDLVSAGRTSEGQEPAEWYVGGMDTYRMPDTATILANATAVQALRIPSVTVNRENLKRAGLAVCPDADEKIKAQIIKEIEANVNAEDFEPIDPNMDPNEEPDDDEGKSGPGDSDGDEGSTKKPPQAA